ncbi:hypothetical protein F2Q68_00031758 [Brassica cretica]|uniref:Uncharacterized protein n=1 Tax=Brassica cretica TaxID=69181 RepID=A0A8S9G692_BRACR|nr:hypothetical protein F2Q68_00031758 [Brassica cretica]
MVCRGKIGSVLFLSIVTVGCSLFLSALVLALTRRWLKKVDGGSLGVNSGGLGVNSCGLGVNSGGLDVVNGSLARWRRLNNLYGGVLGWWSPPQR